MEEFRRLGDVAIRLEKYMECLAAALGWVVYGMIFAAFLMLELSLTMLGFDYRVAWLCIALAMIISTLITIKLKNLLPIPRNKVIRRRFTRLGLILILAPFFVSYVIIPNLINVSVIYYGIIWYPSLGVGLLLTGLYVERGLFIKTMTYGGLLMTLTSVVLPFIRTDNEIALILLCMSMTLIIYFVMFAYAFIKAQRVLYA